MARERPSKRLRRPLEALAGRLAGAEDRQRSVAGAIAPPAPQDLELVRRELGSLRRADEELAKAVRALSGAALAVDLASLREEVRALRHAEASTAAATRDFPLERVSSELTGLREELTALRLTQQGTARGVRDEGAALRQAQERTAEALREDVGSLRQAGEATVAPLREEISGLAAAQEASAQAHQATSQDLRDQVSALAAGHDSTHQILRDEVSGLAAAHEVTHQALREEVSGLAAAHETTLRPLRDEVGGLAAAQEAATRAHQATSQTLRDQVSALAGAHEAAIRPVGHELAALAAAQAASAQALRAEVADLRRAHEASSQAVAERLAAQEATAHVLREELVALRRDQLRAADAVEGLRGLTARSAERDGRWPERLAALRSSREWRWAYSEREPLVTVRIATHNRAATLCDRAIASVLRQSYERWEIVVVGDGCTDDTDERIAALGHPRIRYHNLPAHGPYPDDPRQRRLVAGVAAMNAGAQMAEGTWIAPLEDDDEWSDDHLEVLVAAALEHQAEIAYGRLAAKLDDPPLETPIGAWPPRPGEFSWQAAIYNTALREFSLDMASRFVGEPAEWNLARRMWEAGVSFFFVDRVVGTQNVTGADGETAEWFRARGAGNSSSSAPAPAPAS